MDFASLLDQFADSDNQTRQHAEGQLANYMNSNFPEFVTGMLQVLVNNTYPERTRQMAGTLFKRAISSLSGQYLQEKQQLWSQMDESVRSQIKMALFSSLSDPSFCVRNAAASSVSAIARIEIPIHMWDNIFDLFRDMIQNPNTSVECRTACVEAIRYICEDLQDFEFSDQMTSSVLLLLLACMQSNQSDLVWQEAIVALDHALTFATSFMENENQCRCVMEVVFNSTQHSNETIQSSAFECLDSIIDLFYKYVSPYFESFFNACVNAIKGPVPETGVQACLTLVTLALVEKELLDAHKPFDNLCSQCGPQLIPALCEAMTNKDEDDDSETMTLPTAAATCLRSFAEVMKDDLVTIVWPFVNTNINSSNWNFKEASIMVFGCMIHGPSLSILSDIIHQGCGILIDMVLHDASVSVRDSAAWVLSQICDGFLTEVPSEQTIALLECLITALDMEPRVAHHAALALSLICDYVSQPPSSQLLQPYYGSLLEKLFFSAEKTGSANNQLRENAAFALISLINCRTPETEGLLIDFYNFVIQKCQSTLNAQGDHEIIYSYQRFYCIALVTLLERLKGIFNPDIPTLISIAFTILSSNNTSAHTQALLLYDAVLVNVGVNSLEFVGQVIPFVVKAIETPNDVPTCNAAITCLSDLLFMIEDSQEDNIQKQNYFGQILRHRDELIHSILNSIDSPTVSREIKPSLFTCLSCFFWVVSDYCIACIPICLNASLSASNYRIDSFDEESVEWVNKLYSSIVDLWDSLSAATNRNPTAIRDAVPTILSFVQRIVNESYISNQLIKNSVLMLRDIGFQLRAETAKIIVHHPGFDSLLARCVQIDEEASQIASEAYNTLTNVSTGQYSSW